MLLRLLSGCPARTVRRAPGICVDVLLVLLALGHTAPAAATPIESSLRYCDAPTDPGPAVADRLLQVAALAKAELEASGQRVAIVARSGQALGWLGHRYSHAGVSLKASPQGPWAVRQLYLACDEQRPRLFDQGMSGFAMGVHDAAEGHIALLLLPPAASTTLEQAALDDRLALQLLAGDYSANAFAFSLLYQNCNQWLAELLAAAWRNDPPQPALATAGPTPMAEGMASAMDTAVADGSPPPSGQHTRTQAQQWLRQQDYQPSVMDVKWYPLVWLARAGAVPWLHTDDHPPADLAAARLQVSMPASIEAFVRQQWPETRRVEICHTAQHAIIRRGWTPLPPGCQPEAGDEQVPLENPVAFQ